jgi:hypothetical protein
MRFIEVSEKEMQEAMPATMRYLLQMDSHLREQYGIEIQLQDTDHVYDSLRIELYEQHANSRYIYNNQIISDIYKYAQSHCCLCGSIEDVQLPTDFNDKYQDSLLNYKCLKCRSHAESLYNGMMYDLTKYSVDQTYPIKNIKTRVITSDHKVIYKRFNELRVINGKLCILHHSSKDITDYEVVYFAGFDIGLRDANDERVYSGDVLLATMQDNRKFWGMVQKTESGWGNRFEGPNPQWGKYSLLHGFTSFPSSLAWAKSFRIIGSVYNIKYFQGGNLTEKLYEQWVQEHQSLLDNIG